MKRTRACLKRSTKPGGSLVSEMLHEVVVVVAGDRLQVKVGDAVASLSRESAAKLSLIIQDMVRCMTAHKTARESASD